MKSSIIMALATVFLSAPIALAGDGPFRSEKVRGTVPELEALLPVPYSPVYSGPLGIHDAGGGLTLVRAGVFIINSYECPEMKGDHFEALASPDLFQQLNGQTLLMPLGGYDKYPVKIVGMNDSGDKSMLYMCLQQGNNTQEWRHSVSFLLK